VTADRHPRLLSWWRDDPRDPGRPRANEPDVLRLANQLAPGSSAHDLGGVMSLNLRLDPAGLVLRVHQPFASQARLLALQQVRSCLADTGLIVPVTLERLDKRLFRCRNRWAELESFIPHTRLPPSFDSYGWLFEQVGIPHRGMSSIEPASPRPLVATWTTPDSLRRWLGMTEATVAHDPEAVEIAARVRGLGRRLERVWVPPARLPVQLVHGDARLSNICRTPDGHSVFFDFGFAAVRPRVHDLAYALVFVTLGMDGARAPQSLAWDVIPALISAYEQAAGIHLLADESSALLPYAVAVLLYHAALDGFTADPVGLLRSRWPWILLAKWMLDNPAALAVR